MLCKGDCSSKGNLSHPKEGESDVINAPLLPFYKYLAGSTCWPKYEYHIPFNRQAKKFRHLGVHFSKSTLKGCFKSVCQLLKSLMMS